MFTNILLPTDGSPLSEAAVSKGIRLAKAMNASVVGFYAIPRFHVFTLNTTMLEDTEDEYIRECKAKAEQILAAVSKSAAEAGVPCEVSYTVSDHPNEAIVNRAKEAGCDLIAMGSHGRSGMRSVLVGSVTQKVLSLTSLPVLVFR